MVPIVQLSNNCEIGWWVNEIFLQLQNSLAHTKLTTANDNDSFYGKTFELFFWSETFYLLKVEIRVALSRSLKVW